MTGADLLVVRQKDHTHAIKALFRQFKAKLTGFTGKETVRNLQHNAGSVTRVRLASLSSPMLHIKEHSQSVANDIMGRFSFNMGNKTHAACIFFELGIIKALFAGQFSVSHHTQPFYYKVDVIFTRSGCTSLNKAASASHKI
ncbi:hypothetical protein D3C73_1233110 [compost metagenome]